jgi:hypothetical protein
MVGYPERYPCPDNTNVAPVESLLPRNNDMFSGFVEVLSVGKCCGGSRSGLDYLLDLYPRLWTTCKTRKIPEFILSEIPTNKDIFIGPPKSALWLKPADPARFSAHPAQTSASWGGNVDSL